MINMITLFLNYERFIVFCQESGVQVECITYAGKIVYGQLCDEQDFPYCAREHWCTFIQGPRDWLRLPCVPRSISLSIHHTVIKVKNELVFDIYSAASCQIKFEIFKIYVAFNCRSRSKSRLNVLVFSRNYLSSSQMSHIFAFVAKNLNS